MGRGVNVDARETTPASNCMRAVFTSLAGCGCSCESILEKAYLGKEFPTGTTWDGEEGLACYTLPMLPKGPANVLGVKSQEFVRSQATAARLKQENAL